MIALSLLLHGVCSVFIYIQKKGVLFITQQLVMLSYTIIRAQEGEVVEEREEENKKKVLCLDDLALG